MYTVGLDVDTHSIMNNLALGCCFLGAPHIPLPHWSRQMERSLPSPSFLSFAFAKAKGKRGRGGGHNYKKGHVVPEALQKNKANPGPYTKLGGLVGLYNNSLSLAGLLQGPAGFGALISTKGGPEIEQISDHMEKHEKPLTEEGFGFYLAGLIEGSGYFGDQ